MTRSTEVERRRLHETFVSLCRIESPTGDERACADWVKRELGAIGLEVDEDSAGSQAGSNAGNLLTRIPGIGERSLMMCAHLDTVPLTAPIEPVMLDGGWQNANPGIIGADNKAAVAVLIELARRIQTAGHRPPVGLELLFTVCEETGLHGAKAFDTSTLRSELGYAFDHATPVGEIVIASPTYQRITADVHGRAAHAGIRPEEGRNAIAAAARAIATMELGRLDAHTTANIGTIKGGTTTNVVAERCRIEGEVRGFDDQRVEQVLTDMIDRLQDAADEAECDLDVSVERMFTGYRTKPAAPEVDLAQRALRACGYEPVLVDSGGGSDVNAFRVNGFPSVNLANGTERNHEPGERVSAAALEGSLELAIALLDGAAA